MTQDEKRQLENLMMVKGLNGAIDPDQLQFLADMVSRWPFNRQEFFTDLLNECEPTKRYEMYQAIAPRLSFKALSFVEIETAIAAKASKMVSHKAMRVVGDAPEPVHVGGKKYAVVDAFESDQAMATVKCHVCHREEHFLAPTPVGAMIEARKAGWTRDRAINKERCPDCPELKPRRAVIVLPTAEA